MRPISYPLSSSNGHKLKLATANLHLHSRSSDTMMLESGDIRTCTSICPVICCTPRLTGLALPLPVHHESYEVQCSAIREDSLQKERGKVTRKEHPGHLNNKCPVDKVEERDCPVDNYTSRMYLLKL
jgi:hypothetical protein